MAGFKDPPIAKAVKKEATEALARRNLERGLRSEWVREDGIWMLSVRTTIRIPVRLAKPLPGRWFVHLNWLFQPIPPEGTLELLRSSFGLTVAGLSNPRTDEACLVRYDVDNARTGIGETTLGRHINVWQPAPVESNVHYPVLSPRADVWAVDEVLEFFLSSSLAEDLDGRLS